MKIDPTVIAAWFGALGTIGTILLFFFEVYKYRKDKPNLKITVKFNQEIFDEFEEGLKRNKELGDVWTINLANTWTMPIHITQVGVINHKGKNAIVTIDALRRQLKNFQINAGTSYDIVITEEMLPPDNVKEITIKSGVGTIYKKRVYFWQKWNKKKK